MFAKAAGLFKNLAIYGLGDAATSAISFLLLPIYVRYLSPEDYGVIALLLTVEVAAKILFRWGVDASFMRFYYECRDERDKQRLASTLFLALLAVNGALTAAALIAAPWLGQRLFDTDPLHAAAPTGAHQHLHRRLLLPAVPHPAHPGQVGKLHRLHLLRPGGHARHEAAPGGGSRDGRARRRPGRPDRRDRAHGCAVFRCTRRSSARCSPRKSCANRSASGCRACRTVLRTR